MTQKADLVLEGGGVRGYAYVGALDVFEDDGWEWQRVAGSSAGAIAAALVAFGFSASQIRTTLDQLDFRAFLDGRIAWVPHWLRLASPLTMIDVLGRHMGVYKGHAFERWLDHILGGATLSESKIPLVVTTVDVRAGEVLYLTRERYPSMKVSRAVRMSMSIPFVFRAVRWSDGATKRICVDGGYLDNYPIDVFDVAHSPRWPTVGLSLRDTAPGCDVTTGLELLLSLYSIQRRALARELDHHNRYRTVTIDDSGVSWLAFDLAQPLRDRLRANGRRAAESFIREWRLNGGWETYIRAFRGGK